jgi:hypothetical protein
MVFIHVCVSYFKKMNHILLRSLPVVIRQTEKYKEQGENICVMSITNNQQDYFFVLGYSIYIGLANANNISGNFFFID